MALVTSPEAWAALATLTLLEIVLGIDNLVFIAILTDRLPSGERPMAYRLGLGGAMFTRILLLLSLSWVMHLDTPILLGVSGKDLIVIVGGLFLIGKSAHEIYEKVEVIEEDEDDEHAKKRRRVNFWGIIVQITIMDIVFSLDSVITAIGMAPDYVPVMVAAIVIAVALMLLFARPIGDFVNRHPSMKLLALSFMLLIGVLLVAEGFDQHIEKGYIYAAMSFALFVELLNMRFRKRKKSLPERIAED